MTRPAAGGGRWVEVDPARLSRWLDGFAERHGGAPFTLPAEWGVTVSAIDGASADLYSPPGVPVLGELEPFIEAANQPRRLGLLLARRGAVAVGVADGIRLVASKVDSSYVQSRTAAGGWSQQRFARRRENQARAAAGDAADIALRLLVPEVRTLAAVVCGGDRGTVETILNDRRLGRLQSLRAERFLDVPEPRLAVLEAAVAAARAVRIRITDPPV